MLLLSVRLVTGNNPWKSNILYMYRGSGGARESESVFGKEYVWVLAYNDISLPTFQGKSKCTYILKACVVNFRTWLYQNCCFIEVIYNHFASFKSVCFFYVVSLSVSELFWKLKMRIDLA